VNPHEGGLKMRKIDTRRMTGEELARHHRRHNRPRWLQAEPHWGIRFKGAVGNGFFESDILHGTPLVRAAHFNLRASTRVEFEVKIMDPEKYMNVTLCIWNTQKAIHLLTGMEGRYLGSDQVSRRDKQHFIKLQQESEEWAKTHREDILLREPDILRDFVEEMLFS
jgi:hypothetical protein